MDDMVNQCRDACNQERRYSTDDRLLTRRQTATGVEIIISRHRLYWRRSRSNPFNNPRTFLHSRDVRTLW